jgi:hypothetical protein
LLLPTERKVESGTSQSKCGTSVHFSNSGIVSFLASNGRLERNKAGEQDVSQFQNNYFAEIYSGSEEGSYVRLMEVCIT